MSWPLPTAPRIVNDCGLVLVLGALLLMAPFGLVPFSNTLPAIALLFLATGSLQRDGACVMAGHAAIAYFATLLGGGGLMVLSVFERLFPVAHQRAAGAALDTALPP